MTARTKSLAAGSALCAALAMLAEDGRADDIQECVAHAERGQSARDEGHWRLARKEFSACASAACPKLVSADCAHWFEDVNRQMPSVVLAVVDEHGVDQMRGTVAIDREAAARLDGRPIELDPGPHQVRVQRPGSPDVVQQFLARAGEQGRTVRIVVPSERREPAPAQAIAPLPEPPAKAHSRGLPPLAIALGAVGIAALGTSVGFDISVASAHGCSPSCDPGSGSDAQKRALVADITLGVGVVSVASAILVWLLDRHEPPARQVGTR